MLNTKIEFDCGAYATTSYFRQGQRWSYIPGCLGDSGHKAAGEIYASLDNC